MGMIMHRVIITDTLGKLAERYYGDWQLWPLIYDHNEFEIGINPNNLTPGIHLVIPYHHGMRVTVEPDPLQEAVSDYGF